MKSIESRITDKSMAFAGKKMKHVHSSHGWDHVQRVINLSEKITKNEKNADIFIVKTAAILHDIARGEEDNNTGKICHAALGSKIAHEFLTAEGLDNKRADHISECILTHRYRNDKAPSSIEAKILYDADKLDSIGAVGIGRAFLFSGEIGAKLHNPDININSTAAYTEEDTAYREYMVKLKHIKDTMLTSQGIRIAEERGRFMEEFFSRLQDEIRGII